MRRRGDLPSPFQLCRVAFLLWKKIAVRAYSFAQPEDLQNLVVALTLTTSSGDSLRIHNAYNRTKPSINLRTLSRHCMRGRRIFSSETSTSTTVCGREMTGRMTLLAVPWPRLWWSGEWFASTRWAESPS